jgi:RNA polymerase sigma-70 factor, ECF subfamily
MLSTIGGAEGAIRREADQIEAALGRGRFRRRRKLDHSPKAEQLVLTAVARAKDGDDDALRFLYLRYADNVYGYVCSIVRDEFEAEDVTQQIFAKLMTALPRYEPRLVPFSAWILRVAHNAAIDHVRARRPVPLEEVHPPDYATDDGAGSRERFADLRLALDALPAEQRDVIVLRFLVGLTPREIAERMGRSEDAVHGLQHRGRRRLRSEMLALAA